MSAWEFWWMINIQNVAIFIPTWTGAANSLPRVSLIRSVAQLRMWERQAICRENVRERGAICRRMLCIGQRIGRDETALLPISWQYTPHSLVNALIGPSLVDNDLMIVSTLHIKLPDWIEIFETWWSIRELRSGPVISYDRLTTCAKHFKIFTMFSDP